MTERPWHEQEMTDVDIDTWAERAIERARHAYIGWKRMAPGRKNEAICAALIDYAVTYNMSPSFGELLRARVKAHMIDKG